MNLLSVILFRKYLLPAFIILLLIFLYSLWGRIPDIDDAWIGVDAYTLAVDGHVHTELMRGINNQEELFVVHHKLLNLQGAFFIRLFGFSLYTLKAISLLYFLVFICLFYLYTVRWKLFFNKDDLLFSFILIIAFPWIFKYSFLYRPEIMMMTYGFVGYILLEKYLEPSGNRIWQLFLAGIFFGLTMATHLNGLILVTSAFFLLLWNRKFFAIPVYGFGVLLAFMIYFYDFTGLSYFELWRHQFFDAPYLDSMSIGPFWLKPVFNLLNEHMRYFHNLKIIVFSVFMFFTLITGFRFLYDNYTNLTRFAILVVIITGIFAMHKSRQYILLNFPYLLMLIVLTFKAIREGKIKKYRIGNLKWITNLLVILFIIFVTVSSYYNVDMAIKKFSADQNRELALKYAGSKESNMNIVAPMTFIFNEINNFNQIQGDLCYVQLQKLDSTVYGEGFLKKANDFNRELIMISSNYQELLGISTYNKGDDFENYLVIDKNEEMIVFKRKATFLE